jgi:hypothetical protein
MTKQIRDTFTFQGNSYALALMTERELIHPFRQFGMMPEMMSTACYCGFYGRYELTAQALILKEFALKEKHDNYLPIDGVIGAWDDHKRAYTYKDLNYIVPFTGMIRLAKDADGEIRRRYMQLRYNSEEALEITLKDGLVVSIRKISLKADFC